MIARSGPVWPSWPETDHWSAQSVAAALLSGRLAVSGAVSRWESRNLASATRLAALAGRRHCTLTTSGSSAIVVALQALGIGPGDVVLMPATTWVSCATSVLRVGATPAFFDAGAESPCLIGESGREPAAILGVHLYAQHFDPAALRARYPNAVLIEDASHAQLAPLAGGGRAGSLGDVSIMSLQSTKILTCGEGGAILTDDDALAARIESLVMDSRRRAAVIAETSPNELEPALLLHGANHAASEPAAALLLDQLDRMPQQSARRAHGAVAFAARLAEAGWRSFADPGVLESGDFYGLAVEVPQARGEVDQLVADVRRSAGLTMDRVYPPVPEGPLYRPSTIKQYALIDHDAQATPYSRRWHERGVVIPHHAFLADESSLDLLAAALTGVRARGARRTRQARASVDVVLVSGGRRDTLAAALAGVERQRVDADVRVTLWVDGPLPDLAPDGPQPDRIVQAGAPSGEPFARVAELRQAAALTCTADYVAFLDDDNVWEPEHLSSLLDLAADGYPAVHSWRTLVDGSGEPASVERFPWLPDGPASADRYRELVGDGVFEPGGPIVRDDVSSGMVDMGEWLFERRLLDILRFSRPRSAEEVEARLGEDDILLEQLRRLGVPTACTNLATLRYRLGGMSNPEYAP